MNARPSLTNRMLAVTLLTLGVMLPRPARAATDSGAWSGDVIAGGVNDRFSSGANTEKAITTFAAAFQLKFNWLNGESVGRHGWVNQGDVQGSLFSNEKLFQADSAGGSASAISSEHTAEVSGAVRIGHMGATNNLWYLKAATASIAGIRADGHWPNQKFFGVGVENRQNGILKGSYIEGGIGDSELFRAGQTHNRIKINVHLEQVLDSDASKTSEDKAVAFARFEFDTHRVDRTNGVDNLRIFFGLKRGIGDFFKGIGEAVGTGK